MKIFGARNEPLPAQRRPAASGKAAGVPRGAAPRRGSDATDFLGLTEADLTPQVQAAMGTLLTEIDDLRAEIARLKARLAETEGLADRDALTPVLNRRAFVRELSRIQTFVQRYGADASLVYFDLDGLKAVNDRFGHAAGDAALKAVAERLAAQVRESDIVGRLGGDEFAVILVQAEPATAEAKAQALATAVERLPVSFEGGQAQPRLTFGVSRIDPDLDPEALLAAADGAMYARKRGGRSDSSPDGSN
ncbi:GGDEF domain-containing protein [Phenylobacterium sp. J367]|uniref:GGDEF domain-containing protein n=1 Tax=Phenylobacterium sp. J367 TaxID=2898435 RepID=UPI002150A783|nr:GGDEF domain-containing protein [Phenylobacterium sp. J367]MCR5877978.1 GGDEF domain-containing protein [Phenylobacterium sp. J367]